MATLGTQNWGSAPTIQIRHEYEYQRSGANMLYRFRMWVAGVAIMNHLLHI